jgi:EAL domain-containing protein (putative c-di-GMP-specific phosphodiesterase class I)
MTNATGLDRAVRVNPATLCPHLAFDSWRVVGPAVARQLDRSLVADIDKDAVQSALVESTMVYAEGVERREEASTLARLGCREFQGYFFARPMPLAALVKLLGDQQDLMAV